MVHIVNTDPTGAAREIADTGQGVEHGQAVAIDDPALAAALLEQTAVWAPGDETAAGLLAEILERRAAEAAAELATTNTDPDGSEEEHA